MGQTPDQLLNLVSMAEADIDTPLATSTDVGRLRDGSAAGFPVGLVLGVNVLVIVAVAVLLQVRRRRSGA